MKVYIRGRMAGKTSLLVSWVLEGRDTGEKRILLACGIEEVSRIKNKYGLREEEVTTISQWLERSRYGKGKVKVAIDNLEIAITQIVRNVDVVSITETGE